MTNQINIRGARLHNLKNISLSIPKGKLIVLTGVSGSGKSTLGSDILVKEGQRQYMEALGMLPFGAVKPPVDAITGLPPTVSIDQRLSNNSPRSTVGTASEVFTYLRLLYARLGHRPCPHCGRDISPLSQTGGPDWEAASEVEEFDSATEESFPCPYCGKPVIELSMAHFSFNKPEGACPTCTGLGTVHKVDLEKLVDEQKSLAEGAVNGWTKIYVDYNSTTLKAAARYYGFAFDPSQPVKDYTPVQRDLLFYGVESPQFRRHFPGVEPPVTVRHGRFEGVATNLLRRYAEHVNEHINKMDYLDKLEDWVVTRICPDCNGTRLRPESRAVIVNGQMITVIVQWSLVELGKWLEELQGSLNVDESRLAEPILDDLKMLIGRLVEVGAGYLTCARASASLSAGEAQRLRLASLLGSSLSGLLYVFDEPTIGLHPRDTNRLISILRRLRDLDNSVLVIEHDLDMINAADEVIDFGPGAGKHGGRIVAQGTPEQVAKESGSTEPDSITGAYLSGKVSIPIPLKRRSPGEQAITIHGAHQHNLKHITVRIPLGLLVAVTGVSGSGKSSLVFDILDQAARVRFYGAQEAPGEHDRIEGLEALDKVVTIDQKHIGRMPRSNAATYADVFSPIREAFAATSTARMHGYSARRFSFNVPGGRCERCEGAGVLSVQMHFLPEIEVRCPMCKGRRFKPDTLEVHYKDYDIAQVLEMTIEEALSLFTDVPTAAARLQLMVDIGLGYLQLGQPATTLSGGEAQRVKLAKELGKSAGRGAKGQTLYLLDEPTTGLHLADIARLLGILQRLVDAGNSVVVIEHNLELIKSADWVIDLGPEGGEAGGELIAEGTPEQISQVKESYTGQFLKKLLSK